MHWPEYDSARRSDRNRPWLYLLLLGSVIGLVFAGAVNSWWSIPLLSPEGARAEPALNELLASESVGTSPTPRATLAATDSSLQAPEFALADLFDAALTRRLADYAGQPVILNFWASWCVPCRNEMPALQRAYEEGQRAGLVVLGINETYIDSLEAAQAFYSELELTFSSVRDDSGITSEKDYQVMVIY